MFSGIPTHHIAYIYGDPEKVEEHVSRRGNRKKIAIYSRCIIIMA